MTDTNITLVLHKKNDLRLEEKPVPEPGPGEVAIQMRQVTICGSDIYFWSTGLMGTQSLQAPVALGHEGSGMVTKLGSGVTSLKVGDHVSIEPATPCRMCKFCKGGRYNLCREVKGLATPGCDGHITRTFCHAADFCHRLPEGMSFEEGAMMEPLAVAVHSTTRGRIKMGDKVLICGAGPIGVLCFLVARARGAVSVCLTDINQQRLEFARKLGVHHVINVKDLKPEEIASEVISKVGDMVDVTMECSGADTGLATGIFCTCPGGVVVAVGSGRPWKEIPIAEATFKEVEIVTSFRYKGSFPIAISMVQSGLVDVKALISHRFNILQSLEAFQVAKEGKGIKVVIDCSRQ